LARRDWQSDLAEMEANQIRAFDLVVVNLYPFQQTIANPDVTTAQALEQIPIGGPAMLRASAKNFAHLTVISNPKYYEQYLSQLRQNNGEISWEFRQKMAEETFALTNAYDGAIASYFASLNGETTCFRIQLMPLKGRFLRLVTVSNQTAENVKAKTNRTGVRRMFNSRNR
jgi:phosphoribosylaminoimidazolecarboxamide formyltransferase/IMP cyclohydrolase